MDLPESVVCSHCNTRVYRQWLLDHVQQELLGETTYSPCSNLVQTLTDLLCALHLYGHLKTPVVSITCSRCCFKAGSVEKFVEHLQVTCEEDMFSCETVAPAQDTAASALDTAAPAQNTAASALHEQNSFKYRVSYQPNSAGKEKGEGGNCEEAVGTSSQGQKMGDWDGQQFQQMMSTFLTDTSGNGRQKTSSEQDTGGHSKVTIDMASVCEDQEDETSMGLIMECEGIKEEHYPSQSVEANNTATQGLEDFSSVRNMKPLKTKVKDDWNKDKDFETNRKKSKTKKVNTSKAKKQQLQDYSNQERDLESHILESHGDVELGQQGTHKCRYCDFTCRWQKDLILHEKHHSGTNLSFVVK
ncbi:uncharacterized protein [Branchiostoma lanceolatum]|uniref:uncharacterized protein n=1 Tax=Branchiostoma lanceolatum TaxID=7740 RepID=UPI003454BC38